MEILMREMDPWDSAVIAGVHERVNHTCMTCKDVLLTICPSAEIRTGKSRSFEGADGGCRLFEV